jgi:hypothetical protein
MSQHVLKKKLNLLNADDKEARKAFVVLLLPVNLNYQSKAKG